MQSGCAGLAKPEGDVPGSVSFPDTLPSGVGADRLPTSRVMRVGGADPWKALTPFETKS